MRGAIIGDIIGSKYEFKHKVKSKEFELFLPYSTFTDDSNALEELKLTLFLKNFNQPVQIDIPSDSKTLEEIMYVLQSLPLTQ